MTVADLVVAGCVTVVVVLAYLLWRWDRDAAEAAERETVLKAARWRGDSGVADVFAAADTVVDAEERARRRRSIADHPSGKAADDVPN